MAFGRGVAGICILHVLSAGFTAHGVEDMPGDKQKPTQSRPVNLCRFHSLRSGWGFDGESRGVVNAFHD